MKRRITLISPDLAASAWTLDPQPFERTIVSLCVRCTLVNASPANLTLLDASGNLMGIFQTVATVAATDTALLLTVIGASSTTSAGVPLVRSQMIPAGLVIPPNGRLSFAIITPDAADVLGQLLLVTEDDYPLEWPA